MLNAGKYNRRITIYQVVTGRDSQGFQTNTTVTVMTAYAAVKTTKGFTLIVNNSDFEKALTNFTIRYSPTVVQAYYDANNSNRDLMIDYYGKSYKVMYLNNVDELDTEIEMQAKEVLK